MHLAARAAGVLRTSSLLHHGLMNRAGYVLCVALDRRRCNRLAVFVLHWRNKDFMKIATRISVLVTTLGHFLTRNLWQFLTRIS